MPHGVTKRKKKNSVHRDHQRGQNCDFVFNTSSATLALVHNGLSDYLAQDLYCNLQDKVMAYL